MKILPLGSLIALCLWAGPVLGGSEAPTGLSGEFKRPAERPGKGDHEKERLARAKERHEALHRRLEEREQKIQKKMEEMVAKHPERADEIREKYGQWRHRAKEKHDRLHERMEQRRARFREHADLKTKQRQQRRPLGAEGDRNAL